ncbi:MAG: MCE family protein [Deltaproteobacteria bacterium]|nr:MCE family protein [Deltaproteobacteria bacterium]
MASKQVKFSIGLFVLIGLAIGAIIIIWAGASDVFLKGSQYTTFFDESVQGLQADSAVKYRGVDIGKVESIKVAPDYRLIEVTMKIHLSGDLEKQTFAQLRTAGITGIVFIELDLIQPSFEINYQEVPFKTDHPIIPSRRSETSRFINDANVIIHNIKQIDFKGISDQLKISTKVVETFLTGEHINKIMAHLESTSVNLDKAVAQIQQTMNRGQLESLIKNTADTLSEASRLINSTRQEIESMKLAQNTAKVGIILETLDKRVNAVTLQLQDTAENLRITSEYLEQFSESIRENPSELIFSRPAPPKKPME